MKWHDMTWDEKWLRTQEMGFPHHLQTRMTRSTDRRALSLLLLENLFRLSRTACIYTILQNKFWWAHCSKDSCTGAKRYYKLKKAMAWSFASGRPAEWVIQQVWQPGDEKQPHIGRGTKVQVHLTPFRLSLPLPSHCWLWRGNPGPAQEGLGHRDCILN